MPPKDSRQSEFLLSEGPTHQVSLPHPLDDLIVEITRLWNLPLYQRARLTLRNHALDELCGRLELVSSPDLPLNPKHALTLRVAGVEFSSRQVTSWTLA